MTYIRNAEALRERLQWAISAEDRSGQPVGAVSGVVRSDVLPAIVQYDPMHLIQVGMRAVIRDIQDWVTGNDFHASEFGKALEAYLLAALITAGAAEDVGDVDPVDPPVSGD